MRTKIKDAICNDEISNFVFHTDGDVSIEVSPKLSGAIVISKKDWNKLVESRQKFLKVKK
jgi:hypothetical protein